MSIIFGTGDVFKTEAEAYAHGCNCAGAMGAGIAVEFRSQWPQMFRAYQNRCHSDAFSLGDVFVWEAEDRLIFNLGTQAHWRTGAKLWAVEKSLTEMVRLAEERGVATIALPRVGAGLGGLPWKSVKSILQTLGENTEVGLIVAEHFKAGKSIT